jgi:hypothetical protein
LKDVPNKRVCIIQIRPHVSRDGAVNVVGDCPDDRIRVGYGPWNGVHGPSFQIDVAGVGGWNKLFELDLKMQGSNLAQTKEFRWDIDPLPF